MRRFAPADDATKIPLEIRQIFNASSQKRLEYMRANAKVISNRRQKSFLRPALKASERSLGSFAGIKSFFEVVP